MKIIDNSFVDAEYELFTKLLRHNFDKYLQKIKVAKKNYFSILSVLYFGIL